MGASSLHHEVTAGPCSSPFRTSLRTRECACGTGNRARATAVTCQLCGAQHCACTRRSARAVERRSPLACDGARAARQRQPCAPITAAGRAMAVQSGVILWIACRWLAHCAPGVRVHARRRVQSCRCQVSALPLACVAFGQCRAQWAFNARAVRSGRDTPWCGLEGSAWER
jgi:hypothetical protein